MKKTLFTLGALQIVLAHSVHGQSTALASNHAAISRPGARAFFPKNWIRGYTDFEVAPSHNEPDLGRCMFPQPASAGGAACTGTASAPSMLSGYIELQPFGRTPARHFFLFFQPRISFGRNIPQLRYGASMEPLLYA